MANIDGAFRIDTLSLNDRVLITEGASDPSAGAGYEAPIGSIYLDSTNGFFFHKFGSGDTDWNKFGEIDASAVFAALKAPTGFVNRTDSTLSFNSTTRTIAIDVLSPATSYVYYIRGVKHTITTQKTLVIPNTTGEYYVYFDANETLQYAVSTSNALYTDNALVSIIAWNATSGAAPYFADERHGCVMDGETHVYLHESVGTRYVSGLGLGGTFALNTDTAAAIQLSIANGVIRDEDLTHAIYDTGAKVNVYDLEQELSTIAQIPVYYRLGTNGLWNIKTADNFALIYSGTAGYTGTLAPYNQFTGGAWQLTEMANNRFAFIHLFATNDIRWPIIAVQGTNQYQNDPQGHDEAINEIRAITDLPFHEIAPLYSLCFKTSTGTTNVTRVTWQQTAAGDAYEDWRLSAYSLMVVGGVTSHSALSGLGNDDHTQYALAGAGSSRTFNFDDLTDINTGTRVSGDNGKVYGLTWNNSLTQYDASTIALPNLADVNVSEGAGIDGYALTWENATNKWVATSPFVFNTIKTVTTGTFAPASGTTTIPVDNTTPLSTEGTQVMTVNITPKSATSTFIISLAAMVDNSSSGSYVTISIFRGTTCIGVTAVQTPQPGRLRATTHGMNLALHVIDAPATTSQITYSIRIGRDTGTWYLGQINNATYGGTTNNAWFILET